MDKEKPKKKLVLRKKKSDQEKENEATDREILNSLIDKLEEENPFQFDFGSFYDVSDRDDPT